MGKTRKPYPPEFWQQMVELFRAGRTPESLAREFEPTAESIGKGASTRRWPSVTAVMKPEYGHRWAVSVTASTMPWRRVSSPPWNVSCWSGAHSARVPRQNVPYSSLSRVGTIRIDSIQRWDICHRSTSSSSIPSTRPGARPQMLNCPLKRGNSIPVSLLLLEGVRIDS